MGIRTEWRCEQCGETARVYHVAEARAPVLDLPRGWSILNGRTYCPAHVTCRIGIVQG